MGSGGDIAIDRNAVDVEVELFENHYSFSDTVNYNGTEMGFYFLLNYLIVII